MLKIPSIKTLSFNRVRHQLYHGNGCTFSELEAAEELARRGNIKTLQKAAMVKRVMTAKAAKYVLRNSVNLGEVELSKMKRKSEMDDGFIDYLTSKGNL